MGETVAHERSSPGRALLQAALVLVVLLVVPVVGGVLVGGAQAVTVLVSGALFGLLLAVRAGWGTAVALLPVLVAATLLGGLSAGSVWWVVLLAAVGAAAGAAARWGLLGAVALVGAATASAPPLPADGSVLVRVLWVGLAAAYAVAVARTLGAPRAVPGVRVPGRAALAGALVLALVVAAAAGGALAWGDRWAYWVPTTVFLLSVPTPGVRWSRAARLRVAGTVAGLAAGAVVALLGPAPAVRAGLALLAALGVVALPRPAWLGAALSTLLLMIVLDPAGSGLVVGETRVVATLAAAALVLAGGTVLAWLARRDERLRARALDATGRVLAARPPTDDRV